MQAAFDEWIPRDLELLLHSTGLLHWGNSMKARGLTPECVGGLVEQDLQGVRDGANGRAMAFGEMRHLIVSVQRIKEDGTKRFLYQGRSKGAVFILNQEHQHKEVWLVEGYATGLSVQAALKSLYRDAAVVVCFSASNMVYVGQRLHTKCYAVADNDTSGTGQRCAEELGVRWGMSEREGEDANDLHSRAGLAAVRQLVRSIV